MITADEGVRGGKKVPLKANVDKALMQCPNVTNVVVVKRTQGHIAWHEGRDLWYHDLKKSAEKSVHRSNESRRSIFILYTSGSTGKPECFIQQVDIFWGHIFHLSICLGTKIQINTGVLPMLVGSQGIPIFFMGS